jgi:ubiquinone/menaquinone biosynthesis C-methylase UbiE
MEYKMDMLKYFSVIHEYHDILDPISTTKVDELIGLLKLEAGKTVLDIACGKGEILARLAERYGISGVGVDLSPSFAADAEKRLRERVSNTKFEILNQDAAGYTPDKLFDVAMCIGASWVYQGHKGALSALKAMTKPGGLILVGEPFWMQEPDEAYLAAEGFTTDMFCTHYATVTTGEDLGLLPLYTLVSNQDDWDRYETLKWYASERFAADNPKDEDTKEILERIAHEREAYLRWGRNTINWAIYLFRKPISAD